MPVDHYENFPVASILMPKRLRRPVAAIYHFARAADDIADEGNLPDNQRLLQLDAFRTELDRIDKNETPLTPLFQNLILTIRQYELPIQPFHDLLDAFSQDVMTKRYDNYAELLDYCRRSANPVGTLMLHLYEEATPVCPQGARRGVPEGCALTLPQNIAYSDAICSSLQLINFWQDVAKDWAIGRIYLPLDEMAQFGVPETQIAQQICDENWRKLMQFQIARARALMLQGAPLGSILTGRIGLEMRMIIAGGLRILDKIESADYDVFRRRPVLRPFDWVIMLAKSAPHSY